MLDACLGGRRRSSLTQVTPAGELSHELEYRDLKQFKTILKTMNRCHYQLPSSIACMPHRCNLSNEYKLSCVQATRVLHAKAVLSNLALGNKFRFTCEKQIAWATEGAFVAALSAKPGIILYLAEHKQTLLHRTLCKRKLIGFCPKILS